MSSNTKDNFTSNTEIQKNPQTKHEQRYLLVPLLRNRRSKNLNFYSGRTRASTIPSNYKFGTDEKSLSKYSNQPYVKRDKQDINSKPIRQLSQYSYFLDQQQKQFYGSGLFDTSLALPSYHNFYTQNIDKTNTLSYWNQLSQPLSNNDSSTWNDKGVQYPLPSYYPLTLDLYIKKQIEFYFSSDNLTRDYHLRGLMDKNGYVDIKNIRDFPRLQSLNVHTDFITQCAKASPILEVFGDYVRIRNEQWKWVLPPAKFPKEEAEVKDSQFPIEFKKAVSSGSKITDEQNEDVKYRKESKDEDVKESDTFNIEKQQLYDQRSIYSSQNQSNYDTQQYQFGSNYYSMFPFFPEYGLTSPPILGFDPVYFPDYLSLNQYNNSMYSDVSSNYNLKSYPKEDSKKSQIDSSDRQNLDKDCRFSAVKTFSDSKTQTGTSH